MEENKAIKLKQKYPIGYKEIEKSPLYNSWNFLSHELQETVLRDIENTLKEKGAIK